MSVNPFSHLAAGQGQQLRPVFERESVALLKRVGCDICTANHTSPCYAGGLTRRGLRDQTIRDGLEGLIVMLPAKQDVPSWSVVGRQANVNDGQGGRSGAWVHPAVICQVSRCGHLVYCCPATSFGNQTIQGKYSACIDPLKRQETFNRYLALERPDTQLHNELGTLKHSGGPMRQQTYVHLDYGYWIEMKNLHRFDGPDRRLDAASLHLLDSCLEAAEISRAQQGRRVVDPSSTARPSPPPSPPKRAAQPAFTRDWNEARAQRRNAAYSALSGRAAVFVPCSASVSKAAQMEGPWRRHVS